MEDWRDRLRAKLKENELSMRALSLKAGQSPDYIKIMLQKRSEPSFSNFLKIAEALGVSAIWLWQGIEVSREDEEFARSFSRLSAKEKRLVRNLVASTLDEPKD